MRFVSVLLLGLVAVAVVTAAPAIWLFARPFQTEANPLTVVVDIGPPGAIDCAANFIRPCPWSARLTYARGEDMARSWTVDFPPGFFFAPDEEVNDESIVGSLDLHVTSCGGVAAAVAGAPLQEATTNTANTLPTDLAATQDNDGNGSADGVDAWPPGLPAVNHDARYFKATAGRLYVNFNIDRLPDGGYRIERVLWLDPEDFKPDAEGTLFCVPSDEAYSFSGLTDNWVGGGGEMEGDEITDSCFVARDYSVSLTRAGVLHGFSNSCTTPPAPPPVPEFPIPDPLPREFIKTGMPRLGQHGHGICWAVAAANSIWWLAKHGGFPELLDEPGRPGLDAGYGFTDIGSIAGPRTAAIHESQTKGNPWLDDRDGDGNPANDHVGVPVGYMRLIRRIIQSAWADWSAGGTGGDDDGVRDPTESRHFLQGAFGWDYLLALRTFLQSTGAPLAVHVIADPTAASTYCSAPAGPMSSLPPGITGALRPPVLNDYMIELARSQDVVMRIPNHVVTGVGYDLEAPFPAGAPAGACPCIIIADGNHPPTHNLSPLTADYDYWRIAASSLADPTSPLIVDTSLGAVNYNTLLCGGNPCQVSALIFISPPTTIPATPTSTPTPTPTPAPTPDGGGTRTPTPTPDGFRTPTPAPTPPAAPHYKCYGITGPAPNVAPVSLQTQFGLEAEVSVGPPAFLCPPALKNGQGDLNFPHLKCYAISGQDPPHIVDLVTQFGVEPNVAVGPAGLLCVPALKRVVSPSPGPSPSPPVPSAPHYECYRIAGEPPNVAAVDLETQFSVETGVAVEEPLFLCAPALKNGEGVLNFPHLKCYAISGQDPPHVVDLVTQFGTEPQVPVGAPGLLCVPALKAISPTPTGSTSLTAPADVGDTAIDVASTAGFDVGDAIIIGPGGATEEVASVAGFGSILLASPLQFAHAAGESVVEVPANIAHGDVDCSSEVDAVDALKVLRYVAALAVTQNEPCPPLGSQVTSRFGDVDCDEGVDAVDALLILRHVAALPVNLPAGCPPIGSAGAQAGGFSPAVASVLGSAGLGLVVAGFAFAAGRGRRRENV